MANGSGARGMLKASQVAAGEENGLKLRIYGERGGLEWSQMEPNSLILRWIDRPAEIVRAGGPGLQEGIGRLLRTPAGHPEGYIEAFGNLYSGFADAIRGDADASYPGVTDGLRTMRFIKAMIDNAGSEQKWTPLDSGD